MKTILLLAVLGLAGIWILEEIHIHSEVQTEVRRVITGMIEPGRFDLGSSVHWWPCRDATYIAAVQSGIYRHTYCWDEKTRRHYINGIAQEVDCTIDKPCPTKENNK